MQNAGRSQEIRGKPDEMTKEGDRMNRGRMNDLPCGGFITTREFGDRPPHSLCIIEELVTRPNISELMRQGYYVKSKLISIAVARYDPPFGYRNFKMNFYTIQHPLVYLAHPLLHHGHGTISV